MCTSRSFLVSTHPSHTCVCRHCAALCQQCPHLFPAHTTPRSHIHPHPCLQVSRTTVYSTQFPFTGTSVMLPLRPGAPVCVCVGVGVGGITPRQSWSCFCSVVKVDIATLPDHCHHQKALSSLSSSSPCHDNHAMMVVDATLARNPSWATHILLLLWIKAANLCVRMH